MDVPKGHMFTAFNKSGVATKKGLQIGACVVDENYQGEIHINLIKISKAGGEIWIRPGDKVIQLVLVPVNYSMPNEVPFDELFDEVSDRGAGWAGSTGTSNGNS